MRYFEDMKQAVLPEALSTQADEVRIRVACNLDDELKAQRWTRRAAAGELGLTPRYVNSRVAGDVDLSASDLAMFSDFLGVPVSRFFAPRPKDDGGNVTSIGRATGGARGRRSLYLIEDSEASNFTVESGRLAPVTSITEARSRSARVESTEKAI